MEMRTEEKPPCSGLNISSRMAWRCSGLIEFMNREAEESVIAAPTPSHIW